MHCAARQLKDGGVSAAKLSDLKPTFERGNLNNYVTASDPLL